MRAYQRAGRAVGPGREPAPFRQAHVNTVFQSYALFPHLNVDDNVAFGLRRKKVKDSEVKTRVQDMLRLVELPGFDKRKPNQISGGQAQRVAEPGP